MSISSESVASAVPAGARAVAGAARESAYVAVGSAVLALQRAQIARHDVRARLATRGDGPPSLEEVGSIPAVRAVDGQLQAVQRWADEALDAVEVHLPTPVQFAVATARELHRDGVEHLRHSLGLRD